MKQAWLYFFLGIILMSCSIFPKELKANSNTNTHYPSDKVIVMQTEDSSNVKFEAIGTVKEFNIVDRSKTARVQNFYTYLTLKVEETQPTNVASNLPTDELKFSWRTDEARDRKISVGDKAIVTVVGNNYTDPTWFRLYDLKKIER
ncbi:hypothetical protein [Anabaena azotica]|uniref:DUF3221 domain-containing protein n=1 Tax=Anabaena azotica FACHB-119 TaxID=947527 RepID=A0ABR8DBB8_9NOST|nr:hypothetical protein [Anabaena azotica]MBD2503497.1 hypothetical protein [Anabaena azotica FACHB-119]